MVNRGQHLARKHLAHKQFLGHPGHRFSRPGTRFLPAGYPDENVYVPWVPHTAHKLLTPGHRSGEPPPPPPGQSPEKFVYVYESNFGVGGGQTLPRECFGRVNVTMRTFGRGGGQGNAATGTYWRWGGNLASAAAVYHPLLWGGIVIDLGAIFRAGERVHRERGIYMANHPSRGGPSRTSQKKTLWESCTSTAAPPHHRKDSADSHVARDPTYEPHAGPGSSADMSVFLLREAEFTMV